MKKEDVLILLKKIADRVPKHDIEKFVFKILLGIWILVLVAAPMARIVFGAREDIEKKMLEVTSGVKFQVKDRVDIGKYEALLSTIKYPEKIERYSVGITRDPFSQYRGISAVISPGKKYNFSLKAIKRILLPIVYKGYIELPDRFIGQVNWREATRFVEVDSEINGYRIVAISKEVMEVLDENGKKLQFKLNTAVFAGELGAILYDKVSKEEYEIQRSSEIGEYKVIDIAPNYVILLLHGKEIKLEL